MSHSGYEKWESQLRKGYLELCVMSILNRVESSYGFELLNLLQTAGLEINEGTLYPMLNRMHKNNWLDSKWETPTDGGHPRRFYQLTQIGRKLLPEMLMTFEKNQHVLKQLMELA